mgnify:CR=1 FL=1
MQEKTLRRILLFWCLFIGLGALGGGLCMLIDPSGASTGMDGLLPGLQKLPFADTLFSTLVFPGIALLCVNGAPQLIAAWLLLRRRPAGVTLGSVCGLLLMAWICIQFVIFPLNVLSTAYFIFGLLEALCAWLLRKKACAA